MAWSKTHREVLAALIRGRESGSPRYVGHLRQLSNHRIPAPFVPGFLLFQRISGAAAESTSIPAAVAQYSRRKAAGDGGDWPRQPPQRRDGPGRGAGLAD